MSLSFDSLGLPQPLSAAMSALGLRTPTPVQQETIPLVLAGRDAIVQAKTGSGKTLAFGLPLLARLQPLQRPQALVVLPTRELALQVCAAIGSVSQKSPLRTVALYGGVGLSSQETALRKGVDLVVGTPGRLKDLLDRGSLNLSHVRILVLDEADQMLDMGFRRDIEFLLKRLPKREQTLILSATMPPEIELIAHQHLTQPAIVKLNVAETTPTEITHRFLRVETEQRLDGLIALLHQESPDRAIVFTRMKHETKRLAEKLDKIAGIKTGFLNGNMSQNARNTMLARFRAGDVHVLVATDVAARGLHIDGLTHVFHYAVPTEVETYIHRSGRTGRAGQTGQTFTLVTPDAENDFRSIRKKVTFEEIPAAPLGLAVRPAPEPQPAAPKPPAPGRRPSRRRRRSFGS